MNRPGDIQVHIGEVKIGRGNETLTALLGSCVGIGILWKEKHLYGLAHCLLPHGDGAEIRGIGARFVNQAVASLIAMMKIEPAAIAEVEVILVGGGNMSSAPLGGAPAQRGQRLIGKMNVDEAERLISSHHLRVVHRDVGGEEGRTVKIDCSTGKFLIKKIQRIA